MTKKIDWLRETIKMPDENPVSRAQLPIIIERLRQLSRFNNEIIP